MLEVRKLEAADEAAWRALWKGYADFYNADVPATVTASTFTRLLDPGSGMIGRVAVVDGELAGFSASVVHAATWSIEPVCYLEDLYVSETMRGRGAGRALIQDLVDLGRARGWARLYWHTQADNAAARRLYDTFTAADGFVRYRLPIGT